MKAPLEIAGRLITSRLGELKKKTREDRERILEEMSARGVLRSTMTLGRLSQLYIDETKKYSEIVGDELLRVLDTLDRDYYSSAEIEEVMTFVAQKIGKRQTPRRAAFRTRRSSAG